MIRVECLNGNFRAPVAQSAGNKAGGFFCGGDSFQKVGRNCLGNLSFQKFTPEIVGEDDGSGLFLG